MTKYLLIPTTAFLAIPLCGCALESKLQRPDITPPNAYISAELPKETTCAKSKGGEAQRFVCGSDIPAQWWTLFQSSSLDQLIRTGLKNSPTMAAAQARLRQAQEDLNARAGSVKYPKADLNASGDRMKTSPAAAGIPGKGSIFNLYNASVSISYILDIFGSGRQELQSLKSLVDFQKYELEAAYLTLTSNIVTTVIKEASLREQLQAMTEILSAQEKQLQTLEKQLALGGLSKTEVLAQRTQLEQTRALLPSLEKELALTRNQLTTLVGKFPDAAAELPSLNLEKLILPQELPLSLPSSLARQRPDIQAAEALLESASAQVGAATANTYPQITLSGSYGPMANSLQDLFKSDNVVWNLGAGVIQPLLNGGALHARKRGAIAAYDQAAAQYRQTVLTAFQNVADALRSLEADARLLKAQADAEATAHESLELTEKQLEMGAVSYVLLLNAERQYQQARISLIQARAARLADTAALFQALGGGWWNRTTTTDISTPMKEKSL